MKKTLNHDPDIKHFAIICFAWNVQTWQTGFCCPCGVEFAKLTTAASSIKTKSCLLCLRLSPCLCLSGSFSLPVASSTGSSSRSLKCRIIIIHLLKVTLSPPHYYYPPQGHIITTLKDWKYQMHHHDYDHHLVKHTCHHYHRHNQVITTMIITMIITRLWLCPTSPGSCSWVRLRIRLQRSIWVE